ncbi:MAG: HAMP domain-containing histidine kinase, partial [Clostridiales bacterium]|nr:HAMP domain-containing histidine kinase [Clostridiales bacterium]
PDPKTPSTAANPNVTVPGENPAPPSAATTPKTDTAEDSTTGHEKTAYFITVNDSRLNIDTLRYQIQMDNKLIMQVWVPMASISESAEISNRFTALIGILTIIMAGIWAFYISDRFSRPIQQISSITKRMSELDFSETLKLKGRDEITQLSDSINNLSFSLDSSIKELNEKNRQLEEDILRERELDKMRRQFMSSVSHELKSPVFLIQGYAEGLKSNILTDETKKNFYCDVIMDEADKMNVLVSDLLDLAQLQSGMFRISPCSFDISILVHDIVRKMQPVFDERDIWASIVQECRNVEVSADPVRIEQVVVNYLNNALVHVDSHKRIQISITCSESKVRVSVYNSGGHIPPDKLDKIWASFYKLDEARTRDIGGTGLGLSIVRAIMDAHGSECGVRNVFSNVDIASKTYLEEGVEFWFEVAQNG